MEISVVVPCYNAGRFIRASLRSVAEQTLAPAEVLVVDDGSSDDSVDAVLSCGLPVELLHTARRGGAGARNAGIRAAKADLVAFLDADDVWYPNHLERALEVIGRAGATGYLNHYDRIEADSDRILRKRCAFDSIVIGSGLDEYVAFFAKYGHFVGMSACVVRRDRALAIGGLREDQVRRHDVEFWLRVVDGHRWVFDPIATSAYRKDSPGNLSSDAASRAYYGFLAFLRNRDAAANRKAFDAVLRERARSALANGFGSGGAEDRERAYAAAFDHLAPRHKLVFGLLRRFPGLFRTLRAAGLA